MGSTKAKYQGRTEIRRLFRRFLRDLKQILCPQAEMRQWLTFWRRMQCIWSAEYRMHRLSTGMAKLHNLSDQAVIILEGPNNLLRSDHLWIPQRK